MPEIMTASHFRTNLKEALDSVHENRKPLIVTRERGEAVVVLSLAEYEGWQETVHLLSSPANARRLQVSIGQLHAGEAETRELAEPDGDDA